MLRFQSSLLHLLYPPHCLHCRESMENPEQLLCNHCSTFLTLLNPKQHCLLCFSEQSHLNDGICHPCHQKKHLFKRTASCFEYAGPAASLIKKFKYSNSPHLARGIAAFMAAQWIALEWPLPDLIIPVPITLTHWIERGYNQSTLISTHLGQLLEVPVKELLTRNNSNFSQAGLNKQQRQQLKTSSFTLKSPHHVCDKTVLLIDDVYTTGSTLECCATALNTGFPHQIYGLTFCQAMR